jgi:hypothetical protein
MSSLEKRLLETIKKDIEELSELDKTNDLKIIRKESNLLKARVKSLEKLNLTEKTVIDNLFTEIDKLLT